MKKLIFIICVLAAGAFAPAPGQIENTESEYLFEVYESIPDNIFESIYLKLGANVDFEDIAKEYLKNKSYYDSINYNQVTY